MLTNKDSITIHLSRDEAASIAAQLNEHLEWLVGELGYDPRGNLNPLAKLYQVLSEFAAGR